MIATGSSILGRRMFGPNTVAKFCTLILFSPECDCTSSRNLKVQTKKYFTRLGKICPVFSLALEALTKDILANIFQEVVVSGGKSSYLLPQFL